MFTEKGTEAFAEIFSAFKEHYIATNPGVTDASVEKAFLYAILRTTYKSPQTFAKVGLLIEDIK